jgi:hypothetical protein
MNKISGPPGTGRNCQVGPSPIWHVYVRTRARAAIPCCARVIYFVICVFECFDSIVWWCTCEVSVRLCLRVGIPPSACFYLLLSAVYEDTKMLLQCYVTRIHAHSGIIYMAYSNTCLEVTIVSLKFGL